MTTSRVFELRTYHAAPGKLAALQARFRDHTLALFARHQMELVAFFTPSDAPGRDQTLVYLLAFPSRAAAERAWTEFRADPDWVRALADSEREGPLVEGIESVFLDPTAESPLG